VTTVAQCLEQIRHNIILHTLLDLPSEYFQTSFDSNFIKFLYNVAYYRQSSEMKICKYLCMRGGGGGGRSLLESDHLEAQEGERNIKL
jgi:hypothetical protein